MNETLIAIVNKTFFYSEIDIFYQFLHSFPSLETYRRFRFSLYMAILEDSTKIGKSATWKKWEQISNYDMRPKEKQYLSAVVSKLRY